MTNNEFFSAMLAQARVKYQKRIGTIYRVTVDNQACEVVLNCYSRKLGRILQQRIFVTDFENFDFAEISENND